MIKSLTSRNDRATAVAYTTSSGETIRIRTALQPPRPTTADTSTSTRTHSLDLISLEEMMPEGGKVRRLSDLSLSSLAQQRSLQGIHQNRGSHRSTATATTAASDFTSSISSLTGNIGTSGSFRGVPTTETNTGTGRKFPPPRKGGSLTILRAPAVYDTAYDNDLDQTTRRRSCPCDLGHMHSVHFGRVEILEFRLSIGDNPSCASGGPPISLSGRPLSSHSIDLDDYETHRTMHRRGREQMMVPPHTREEWLRDAGYGSTQIHESIARASVIRRQREKSIRTSTAVHELSQRFKKATSFLKKSNQRHRSRSKHAASAEEDEDDNTKKIDPLGESSGRRHDRLSDVVEQKQFVDALAA